MNTGSYIQTLRDNLEPQLEMVVCVLPSNKSDLYNGIKKLCCVERPVPSQCVLVKTIKRKERVMSVATKIALQMNVKLGGPAWATDIPMNNFMVCGVDTYHDSQNKGQSVAALVCSLNKSCTTYYSKIVYQTNMQELASGLNISLTAGLKAYHKANGALPAKIFFYRDGVGDGQLQTVIDIEIPQILSAFKNLGQDYSPKVIFIVVKKRINTRFFAGARGNNYDNPPPGTIVDRVVTRPEWYDFFMVAQSVRQGTTTPTHYNVLYDTIHMKGDHIQKLTYKLCHLYFNWPGTIRVPAPCQYAHKLAFLVGTSLHREPAAELADKLYYL